MTELEKIQAITLKGKGKGYKVIASLLSLSENTIKSFLRREYKEEKFCKNCGKTLNLIPNKKPKTFCSSSCRIKYWRKKKRGLHDDIKSAI